jgi:hypothetical protein
MVGQKVHVESGYRHSGPRSSGSLAGFLRPDRQYDNHSAAILLPDRGCSEFRIDLCLRPFDHRPGWNLSRVLLLHAVLIPTWDAIRYTTSTDGKTWSVPQIMVLPSWENGMDIAACDPSLVFYQEFYYLYYSSAMTTAPNVFQTIIEVARSAQHRRTLPYLHSRGALGNLGRPSRRSSFTRCRYIPRTLPVIALGKPQSLFRTGSC